MNNRLCRKIERTIEDLRRIWKRFEGKHRFVGFSTGKDSLAVAAMLYEAVAPEKPPCVYVDHSLEFPSNLDYVGLMKQQGFAIETVRPHLGYFELVDRGMGFLTLRDAWCIPMLIGTGVLEWLKAQGGTTPREGLMFRGMSGSEYSRKFHAPLEVYRTLDLPCFNPLLGYTRDEILRLLKARYHLELNPLYDHMDRTYCICCYTCDQRRQTHSAKHHPDIVRRYYGQIESMLFDSGLAQRVDGDGAYATKNEKLVRHGFIHWRRRKAQNTLGAVKYRHPSGMIRYVVRDQEWIDTKHLRPLRNRWLRKANELRFWGVSERVADAMMKRMLNCVNCGYCMVECFSSRRFNNHAKCLDIDGCVQCGRCLRVRFCMGWRHRFWRRVILDGGRIGARTRDGRVPVSHGGVSGKQAAGADQRVFSRDTLPVAR